MNIRIHNTFFAIWLLFSVASFPVFAGAAFASSEGHSKHVRSHPDLEIYTYEATDICGLKVN